MRRLRIVLPALVGMVAVSFGAGVALASAPSAGQPRGIVALVGDSNIVRSAAQVDSALLSRDNGYIVVDAARPGASIRLGDCPFYLRSSCTTTNYWKARIAALRAAMHPDVFVVDIGINDSAAEGTATNIGYANYVGKIDWMMSLFGDTPVLWTNLPCGNELKAYQYGCARVDYSLAVAARRHPTNLQVLDWSHAASPHPEWMCAVKPTGECIPGSHGVHLTSEGSAAWASLVSAKLDSMFAAP